jgi:DNA-binding NarL/FixJ family response regulator
MPPLRVAIVDDHEIVRDGIKAMADRMHDLEFVGGASNSKEAFDLLDTRQTDVVLLDYRLGTENGFEVCNQIVTGYPGTRVLIFTAFGNPELLTQAIRAGASGYVLKDTNTRLLPEMLRRLEDEGSCFDGRLAGQTLLATVGRGEGTASSQALAERDLAVLRLVAEGKSNQEIASELFVSPHTVKFYVTRLLRKYDVHRRSELARVAADMFLTS